MDRLLVLANYMLKRLNFKNALLKMWMALAVYKNMFAETLLWSRMLLVVFPSYVLLHTFLIQTCAATQGWRKNCAHYHSLPQTAVLHHSKLYEAGRSSGHIHFSWKLLYIPVELRFTIKCRRRRRSSCVVGFIMFIPIHFHKLLP